MSRPLDFHPTERTPQMSCNCIETINAELTEHQLDISIMWSRERNTLEARTYTSLKRRDNGRPESRRNKPRLFAHTFCPFCGTRYEPEEER